MEIHEMQNKARLGKKYLQNIYPIKDLYPEFYCSIDNPTKNQPNIEQIQQRKP